MSSLNKNYLKDTVKRFVDDGLNCENSIEPWEIGIKLYSGKRECYYVYYDIEENEIYEMIDLIENMENYSRNYKFGEIYNLNNTGIYVLWLGLLDYDDF